MYDTQNQLSFDGKPSPDHPRTPTLLRRFGVLANATSRKHKRAKRVMTPRNRMRNRKQKRITSYSTKPSKLHLSYSRKKHRKLRTKTIKRYRKRLSFEDSTAKVIGGFSGFNEEELLKGIIVFANKTPDVKDVFKDKSNVFMPTQYDYNSADDFKNMKSLPLLMSIYSVIIKPEFISGSTSVNSVIEPEPAKPTEKSKEGIHLSLAINGGGASPASALPGGSWSDYIKPLKNNVELMPLPARFNRLRKSKLYDKEFATINAITSLQTVKKSNDEIKQEIEKLKKNLKNANEKKSIAKTYYKNAINEDEPSKTIYKNKNINTNLSQKFYGDDNSKVYYASKQVKLIEKYVSYIEQKLQEINDYKKKLNDLQGIVTKSTEQFIPKVKLNIAIQGGSNGLIQTEDNITVEETPTSGTIKALKKRIQIKHNQIDVIVETVKTKYDAAESAYKEFQSAAKEYAEVRKPDKPQVKQTVPLKNKIEKEIPNKILLKFVISKIREIERKNPHPDLLNTFLYFFDIIDFPSALAMVNLYLNKLYELTKGKDMSFDQITTYLEKNLAHHASVEDWKAAFNAITDPDEKNKMLLKYTSVVNSMDKYERANSELNALFSSAWVPFDISNEERNLITNTDKSTPGIQYRAVSAETAKGFRAKSPSSKKDSSASEVPEIPYTPGKVWWGPESEKANFQVVPNGGNGDCYFLSIAQALNDFNIKRPGFFEFLNGKIKDFINAKINKIPEDKYKVLNKGKPNIDRLTEVIPSNTVYKFDYVINGDITVANMRSLLVLYYFSDGFANKYVEGIMNGKFLSANTPNAGLNDIHESFKGFHPQVAVLNGIQHNVSRILSNTYFAEEASISILQELLWFQTIALSNSLPVGIIATTHYVPYSNFVVYIIVNYTNNIHYELIKYIHKSDKTTVSTFKYPDLPPQIKQDYTDMVTTSSERHDDNVWIVTHVDQEGLNVSASYNSILEADKELSKSNSALKIKDSPPPNDFILITAKNI